jgi:HK97 family phage prohead protease
MGEVRAAPDALTVGDFVSWNSSGGRARGKIERIVRDGQINVPDTDFTITGTEDDPAALIVVYRELSDGWRETDTQVGHKFSTLTLIDDLPLSEERAINQEAPAYMRAAARRGLEYYEQGLAGDGVTPGTIREARAMAEGTVSDDKWVRIAAWIARHLVDLDSPDANPESDNYPSAGVVAHLLWGSGPSKRAAQRTKDYADSVVARIRAEETNSMDNKNKWLDVARAIALKIDGPKANEPEVRTNSVDFELRAEGDGMTFTGYASVFNSPSQDLGGFIEYVAPGAFKRSLQSRNEVKLLWNHDAGEPLASLRGGSMQLVEDDRGLKVTATLPQTSRGKDVAELLRTKVIDSMSFGFNVIKDTWSRDGQTRTLDSVRLFEVSIVSFPAYEATTAQVRSQPTINPDQLADALLKLESGEELDEPSATLITEVVNKLKANPGVEEVIDNGLDLLDLKKKQFDLLLKRI